MSRDESEFQNSVSQFWNVDLTKEITDPLLKRYVEYSLSTNERAEQLANRVANCTDIRGKRYLDVGCAYGGCLVAFKKRGANEVFGIDIDERLLKLAQGNINDNRINADIRKMSVLDKNLLKSIGKFDIITCMDVIEHVEDPLQAIVRLTELLNPGGLLVMAIPNAFYVGHLKADGHFNLPGITLLPKLMAEKYHDEVFHCNYTMGHYHLLSWYFYHLTNNYITPKLMNSIPHTELSTLISDFNETCNSLKIFDDRRINDELNLNIRAGANKIQDEFNKEISELQSIKLKDARYGEYLEKDIILRFGTAVWELVGFKQM